MDEPIGVYLKDRTREAHENTEALLLGSHIRSRTVSMAQYKRLIRTTFLAWSSAQSAISDSRYGKEFLPDITVAITALSKDMQLLGLPKNHPSVDFPPPASVAEAFGIAYVLFGSTMGGRMIVQLLKDCPELSHLPDYHFYKFCGSLPKDFWPDFKDLLAANVTSQVQAIAAGDKAIATFSLYSILAD